MFRFNSLHVKDWCQHKERTETFVPGTNGIIGSNGRGKSNLVTALFTAVTGRVLVDTIQENINFEADKTIIEAEFVQNGIVGTIRRAFNAPRIEGNPKDRKDPTSTAELTFGDAPKIKGASKVTAELERITGMSPRTIEDHVFISQNRMDELLFQRKSDRMRSFLTLIPSVDKAEPLRTALQNELTKFMELTLTSTIEEAQMAVETIQGEINQLEGMKQQAEQVRATLDLSKAMQVITKYKETVLAESKLASIIQDMSVLQMTADSTIMKMAMADKSLSDALHDVEIKQSTALEAQVELKSLEQSKQVFRTRKTAQDELDKLMSEIEAKSPPRDMGAPWKDLGAWETRLAEVQPQVAEAGRILAGLAKGDNCPTCNRPFEGAAEQRAKATEILDKYKPTIDTCKESITRLTKLRDAYTAETTQYANWLKIAENRLQYLTSTLESLPVVQEPTEDRIALLTKLVADWQQAVSYSKMAETESKNWSGIMQNTTHKINALEKTKDELEAIVATRPSADDLAKADLQQRQYEATNTNIATAEGQLKSKREELTRAEAAKLRVEVMAAKAQSITEYRALISSVRDVLHRDKLPHEVLLTHLQQLDTLCNRYLDLFGNPFAISIDKEMDISCYFPNGYVCGSQRLSGGQKCVLSVAMRFAINELFVKDLGLLILDEPTEFMDTANIAYMGELIERIHTVGKGSGVQTIIITHAQELVSSFEHVIKV